MKKINFKNTVSKVIFMTLPLMVGVGGGLLLSSCNDFLEVEAPSSYTEEFVFTQKSEIERALNGVYAQALVGNLYGDKYQNTFIYNSDVDMKDSNGSAHSHTGYQRLDCDAQGGDIKRFWVAAYSLIEYCNRFISSIEASPIYTEKDEQGNIISYDNDIRQWLGEAKCLRAMVYHDLVVMFGDIPFTMKPAASLGVDYVIPVADRNSVQDALIADLKEIAPYMSSTNSVTVERCSKEFAHALIARIALTAGGYSLRPDKNNAQNYGTMQRPDNYKDYYAIAMNYADSVISAGTHNLNLDYQDVFVNECNYRVVNNDDPIFEIPFAKKSTGNTGYIQGPSYSSNEGKTVGPWGECDGGRRLNAFYRFLFRTKKVGNNVFRDRRCEFVNGMWYYNYYTNSEGNLADSVYIRNDRTVHNNKWSKLWTDENSTIGNETSGSTGINFPYMRYTDVLLMYAEAANEINNGPTEKAVDCLAKVHARAFADGDDQFIADAQADKQSFLKAVLDERKWEFAGENMRWRDLVRNNMYGEELMYSFLRYYSAGSQNAGGPCGFEDAINIHDGFDIENGEGYIDNLPERIYYHAYDLNEPITAAGFLTQKTQFYGYQFDNSINILKKYPLQKSGYKSLRIHNAYAPAKTVPTSGLIKNYGFKAEAWNNADFYQWGDANSGQPNDYCKYSFYGYIRSDANGNIWLIKDGAQVMFDESYINDPAKLPAPRYILPYPQVVIQRSEGAYKNYYGY